MLLSANVRQLYIAFRVLFKVSGSIQHNLTHPFYPPLRTMLNNMIQRTLIYGLVLLQAVTIRAVIVPAGLPAGLYSIPFDANGDALGEPVLLRAADSLQEYTLPRRQNSPPALPASREECGTGGSLNINNFAVAKESLQSVCDYGDNYNTRTAVVFTTGSAIAYFCTYDSPGRCWRQEVEDAMLRIVSSCGSGKGGESYIPSYSKSYGGDNAGQQVCRF